MKEPTANVIEYSVTYRESADSPQWEEVKYTKEEAEAFVYKIHLNGGIAVIVERPGSTDPFSIHKEN